MGSHERPQGQGAAGPRLPALVPGSVGRAADPVGEQLECICYVTANLQKQDSKPSPLSGIPKEPRGLECSRALLHRW